MLKLNQARLVSELGTCAKASACAQLKPIFPNGRSTFCCLWAPSSSTSTSSCAKTAAWNGSSVSKTGRYRAPSTHFLFYFIAHHRPLGLGLIFEREGTLPSGSTTENSEEIRAVFSTLFAQSPSIRNTVHSHVSCQVQHR